MSFEFILRIIGMIVLAVAGGFWGYDLSRFTPEDAIRTTLVFSLVGALTGLILTPYFTTRPARAIRSLLGRMTAESLFAGLTGLVVGLLIAALLAFPLSMLPQPFSQILPFIGVLIFSYFGVSLFVMRQGDIMGLLSALSGRSEGGSSTSWSNLNRNILLDTSVIIDGRVSDIAKTDIHDIRRHVLGGDTRLRADHDHHGRHALYRVGDQWPGGWSRDGGHACGGGGEIRFFPAGADRRVDSVRGSLGHHDVWIDPSAGCVSANHVGSG